MADGRQDRQILPYWKIKIRFIPPKAKVTFITAKHASEIQRNISKNIKFVSSFAYSD